MDHYTQQIQAQSILIQSTTPFVTKSSPGTGKTQVTHSIMRSLSKLYGYTCPTETVILALRSPEEIGGMYVMRPNGDLDLVSPSYARRLSAEVVGDKIGLLYFDEIGGGSPMSHNASLRIINEGIVADTPLGPRICRGGSMNPPELGAGGNLLPPPMANRVVHVEWQHSTSAVCEWAISGSQDPELQKLPDNWLDLYPAKKALVASFLHAKPTLANDLPKSEEGLSGAFPTPRSWFDLCARIEAACAAIGAHEEVRSRLIIGCVGDGAAKEYITYTRELDLPDPEEVLKSPLGTLRLPPRGDRQYAILTSLGAAVMSKNTKARWTKGIQVFASVKDQCPDIAALAVKMLLKNKPSGVEIPKELEAFADLLVGAGILKL